MDAVALGDSAAVFGGVAAFSVVVLAALLLSFLLLISPLMIWLNLRQLRKGLHADLAALRESVDRLAGVTPPAEAAAPEGTDPTETPAAAKEDLIGFSCPGCGKFFEGPSSLAGANYTCPECGVDFHIH